MPRDLGNGCVALYVEDVAAFAARWPGSGLQRNPVMFEFEVRGDEPGDLVDAAGIPEDACGGAVCALADDARAWLRAKMRGQKAVWLAAHNV